MSELATTSDIRRALQDVKDPEIPTLSLEELGMVYEVEANAGNVYVRLIPTFIGCPAVEFIRNQVHRRLEQVAGISQVEVTFVMDVPWTSERITEEGRTKLENFGIAPPPLSFNPSHVPRCPYCSKADTNIVSLFGPTACRAVYYCKSCKQPFEGMKFV